MGITRYLAMTGAEIAHCSFLPPKIAWMACHFSAYGTGLSNLPDTLPAGSMLILNDRTPWHGHDPHRIAAQLEDYLTKHSCSGLLLDFQRPGIPEVAQLSAFLSRQLAFPVGVSEPYVAGLETPVFLPPVPLQQTVQDYLAPWKGREIWLELALDCEELVLTEEGCTASALPCFPAPENCHEDQHLHCHYRIQDQGDSARFLLHHTRADLHALLEEAAQHGITTAIGLWQELHA